MEENKKEENAVPVNVPPMVAPRDWNKIVESSKGELIFLPEESIDKAKEIEKQRVELNKKIIKINKLEIEMSMETQNMFFELRKNLEKNGIEDIWGKDIGFEGNALKDGKFVICLSNRKGKTL